MDQALTTTIQQLQHHETTEIETILPQLPIFITNLQKAIPIWIGTKYLKGWCF